MAHRHQSFDQFPVTTPAPETGETAVQRFQKLQQELRFAAYAYEILPVGAMLKDDIHPAPTGSPVCKGGEERCE